jgi:hypothetical protein
LDPDLAAAPDLATLSKASIWERNPEKTRSAARALYLRLPAAAKL